jgi:hypothetical protein
MRLAADMVGVRNGRSLIFRGWLALVNNGGGGFVLKPIHHRVCT